MNDVISPEISLEESKPSYRGVVPGTFSASDPNNKTSPVPKTEIPNVGREINSPESLKRNAWQKSGELLERTGIEIKTNEQGEVVGMTLPANLLAEELLNEEKEKKTLSEKIKGLQETADNLQTKLIQESKEKDVLNETINILQNVEKEYQALMLKMKDEAAKVLTQVTPTEIAPKTLTKELESKSETTNSILRPTLGKTSRKSLPGVIEKASAEKVATLTPEVIEPLAQALENTITSPKNKEIDEVINSEVLPKPSEEPEFAFEKALKNMVEEISPEITPELAPTEIVPTMTAVEKEPTPVVDTFKEEPALVVNEPVLPEVNKGTETITPKEPTLDLEQKRKVAVQSVQDILVQIRGEDWKKYIIPTALEVDPESTEVTPAKPTDLSWRESFPKKQLLEDITLDEKTFVGKYVKSDDSNFSEKILQAACYDIFNKETEKSLFGGLKGITVDTKGVDHRLEMKDFLGLLSGLDEKVVAAMPETEASKVDDVYSSINLTLGDYITHVKANVAKADSYIKN